MTLYKNNKPFAIKRNFRFDVDMFIALVKAADKRHLTYSALFRNILREWLDSNE